MLRTGSGRLSARGCRGSQLSQEIYSSLRWLAASRAIAQAIAWASTVLVIRLLTPADYGLVTMATIVSSYLLFLGDFGVGPGLVSRREHDRRTLEAAQGLSLGGSLILFALVFASAPFVAVYFDDRSVTRLVQVSALMFVAVGLATVPRAMLQIDMRFREISIASLISSLVTTVVTVVLAYAGFGPWALVLGTVGGAFCLSFALMTYAGAVRPRLTIEPLRGFLGFSAYTLAERSIWYWYSQIDSLIVGRVLGQQLLGVLTVGKDIAAAPVSKVVEVSNQVAFPYFARHQHATDKLADSFRKAMRIAMALAFPALWGLAATAADLVQVLLGPKWKDVAFIVAALASVMPLRIAISLSTALLFGIGRADQAFRNMAATLVVVAVLLIVAVRWGLAGVCVAWIVAIPFAFALALHASCRHVRVSARVAMLDIARSSVPALLMVAACLATKMVFDDAAPPIRLIAVVVAGAIVWPLAAFCVSRPMFDELVTAGREFFGRGVARQ